MSRLRSFAATVATHHRAVIVALLVISALLGAGVANLEVAGGDLGAESEEMAAYERAEASFDEPSHPTTLVVVHGNGSLTRASLLDQLRMQRAVLGNETTAATLATNYSMLGIANAVALAAILEDRRVAVEATGQAVADALNDTRELQARLGSIDRAEQRGEIDNETAEELRAETRADLEAVVETTKANLSASQAAEFDRLVMEVRSLQREVDAAETAAANDEIDSATYFERVGALEEEFAAVYARIRTDLLAEDIDRLEAQAAALTGTHADRRAAARNGRLPTLEEQHAQLASMNQSEIDAVLEDLLAQEATAAAVGRFLPTDAEATDDAVNATLLVVTHDADPSSSELLATHRAIEATAAAEHDGRLTVFSQERTMHETERSTGDSLLLTGPFALLLLLASLAVAYRDLLDIVLGVVGVFAVLLWTVGFMGWVGIAFHPLFVAIPLLLVGLAIDFAIHLVMRYREAAADGPASREGSVPVRRWMRSGLAGVLAAFLWVTVTTSAGFLSNLVSPVPAVRQFGVVSAAGIVATCVVFSTLVPALKIEVAGRRTSRGDAHRRSALGSTGWVKRSLETAASLATTAPWAVLVVVLGVSLVAGYGATHVDTSSDRTMFVPEEPASWTYQLPEPLAPGEYTAREAMLTVDDRFVREDTEGWILIEESITDPATLRAVARGHESGAARDRVVDVESPLSAMETVAADNESFNHTYVAADTTGDGVPDSNLTRLYDEFYAAAPSRAADVLDRSGEGDYERMLVVVVVESGASDARIDAETRAVAATIDGDGRDVTPTGRAVSEHVAQTDSRDAALGGMAVTLVVVFTFLAAGYRWRTGYGTLGIVTLLPMLALLSWVFGTMAALDVPLNALTAVISSFTVALGVDYCLHVSERFREELHERPDLERAVNRSLVGTGGALVGSALTTALAFGVLSLAINPALEQFGTVMAITIVYAFLASVFVLPSLLVVWTQYTGFPPRAADDR